MTTMLNEAFPDVEEILARKTSDGYLLAIQGTGIPRRDVPLPGAGTIELRASQGCAVASLYCDLGDTRTERQFRVTFAGPRTVRIETAGTRLYIHLEG